MADPHPGSATATTTPGPIPSTSAEAHDGRSQRRKQTIWIGAVVALTAATFAGWEIGRRVQSPQQAASEAAPPFPSWVTATVERRVLSQTVISRGDVRPQVSANAGVPLSVEGEPVVTGISVAAGDQVAEGQRLIEVSGRPIFALTGSVPVYRSLRPGMSGADVAQLQEALMRLGCANTDERGVYGESTKQCVAAFYAEAGYAPVPSSTTELVDVAATEQAVSEADAAVATAEATLQAAGEGDTGSQLLAAQQDLAAAQRAHNDAIAASATSIAIAQADVTLAQADLDRLRADPEATEMDIATAEAEVNRTVAAVDEATRSGNSTVAATADAVALANARLNEANNPDVTTEFIALGQALEARDKAVAAHDALRTITGPTVPQGEVVFVPTLPARVRTAVASLGPVNTANLDGTGTNASTAQLVVLSAGTLVVSMNLQVSEHGLVRVGQPAGLLDEQTNTTYPASITAVADTPITGADGQTAYPAEVTPDKPLPPSLTGANLRVTITAAATASETLVVPLAAISSAADGTISVSVLIDGNEDPTLVPVTTGLSADGFVAVEPVDPDTLSVGDQVVVGR